MAEGRVFSFDPDDHAGIPAMRRRLERLEAEQAERRAHPQPATYTCPDCGATHAGWADGRYVSKWWCAACYRRREETMGADTPEQVARWAIAAYREYAERYDQSPDEATEAAVREVLEGLAVDVDAERAEMAENPGPTPGEMEGWPL